MLESIQRRIEELERQLAELTLRGKAASALRAYGLTESDAEILLRELGKLPLEKEKAFQAAIDLVICGISDTSLVGEAVRTLVEAEGYTEHDYWEKRLRLLCRVIATGIVRESDKEEARRLGLWLPLGSDIRQEELLRVLKAERAVPLRSWWHYEGGTWTRSHRKPQQSRLRGTRSDGVAELDVYANENELGDALGQAERFLRKYGDVD